MTGRMDLMREKLRAPKGILFDFGDTVLKTVKWDPRAGTERLLQIANNPRGLGVDEVRAAADALAAELDYRRAETMIEFSGQAFHRLLYGLLGITFDVSDDEVELEFWKAVTEHVPEDGIEDALRALRGVGLALGMVSNTMNRGQIIARELERHGLLSYFVFVMSSTDYGLRKPHPILMRTAAAKLGLDPADVWYLGNLPNHDVAAALNAGMGAIWYNAKGATNPDPKPHAEIHHWKELPTLVDQLVA